MGPDIEEDLRALTDKVSPFYDKDITDDIINRYGFVENYKKSDEFIKMKTNLIDKL
jgi:hypothetical protein